MNITDSRRKRRQVDIETSHKIFIDACAKFIKNKDYVNSLGTIDEKYVIKVKYLIVKTKHNGDCSNPTNLNIEIENKLVYLPTPSSIVLLKSNMDELLKKIKLENIPDENIRYNCCISSGTKYILRSYKMIHKTPHMTTIPLEDLL